MTVIVNKITKQFFHKNKFFDKRTNERMYEITSVSNKIKYNK